MGFNPFNIDLNLGFSRIYQLTFPEVPFIKVYIHFVWATKN
ncbi:hypothetical protein FHS90_000609 [Rufibacter quisquiliarum]|uniref:Uncharacterized protein n=1 Tax=Rufibacter quisquiliarum TaxID=1549639 RepID=A0A839GLU0_9BACT|nr:hypothetical protein [Rufibacter quisquiliarum]